MTEPKKWPASKVSLWPLARIIPYERNPRTHPEAQIALLAQAMTRDGVTMPILVDDAGVIIAGHGRLLAAQRNGFERYPVAVAVGWTEQQKQAVRLQDNAYGLMSGWDIDLLKGEIRELKAADYPILTLGFPELELRGFGIGLGTDPIGDEAELAPEPPKNPVSRRGDVWLLGEHRLVCGDSTSESDVALCLNGAKPHLMVTDPPYGVEYDPNWRNDAKRSDGRVIGAAALGKVQNDDEADWSPAWNLYKGDVGYIWHAGRRAGEVARSLNDCGFFLRAQIIWRKNRTIIGRGDYHYNHEPCWYVVREKKTGHWCGARDQGTVWDITHDPNTTGHGTQKPIECMRRPILNNSKAGEHVYEPFAGSGTTIIAADMEGRRALALEIDPAYVDVCVERWQNFTKEEATLASSTRSFEDVRAERLAPKGKAKAKRAAPAK